MSSSTLQFLLLVVGMSIVLGSVVGFFAMQDQDFKYVYEQSHDDYPHNAGPTGYYEELSPEQQQAVDAAIAGTPQRYEDGSGVPPEVVKKNGTYHEFDAFSHFDWGNPNTFGPVLVGLFGLGVTVEVARRDVRRP
ncbi:hypothetical protein [Natronomonas sp. EA1]|uniref:hypothetical protein n=1 Tax=Natronomonas sp. EA1 TaxID=3421655 RepID=UPI003EBF9E9F